MLPPPSDSLAKLGFLGRFGEAIVVLGSFNQYGRVLLLVHSSTCCISCSDWVSGVSAGSSDGEHLTKLRHSAVQTQVRGKHSKPPKLVIRSRVMMARSKISFPSPLPFSNLHASVSIGTIIIHEVWSSHCAQPESRLCREACVVKDGTWRR